MKKILICFVLLFANFALASDTPQALQSKVLKFYYLENDDKNEVVTLLFKGAGYASDDKQNAGIAYLASQALQAQGIVATLDKDNFYVTIQAPKDQLKPAMDKAVSAITFLKISDEEFAKIKLEQTKKQEELSKHQGAMATMLYDKAVYGQHPYGNSMLGTTQTSNNITKEQLAKHLREKLAQNNLHISYVGSQTLQKIMEPLESSFINLTKIASMQVYNKSPENIKISNIVADSKEQKATILIGYEHIAKDAKEEAALELLRNVIFNKLAIDKNKEASINFDKSFAAAYIPVHFDSYIASSRFFINSSHKNAIKERDNMIKLIDQIAKGDISQHQLEEAKAEIIRRQTNEFKKNIGMQLAQLSAKNLAPDYYSKLYKDYDAIDAAAVKKLAADIFKAQNASWVLVADEKILNPKK